MAGVSEFHTGAATRGSGRTFDCGCGCNVIPCMLPCLEDYRSNWVASEGKWSELGTKLGMLDARLCCLHGLHACVWSSSLPVFEKASCEQAGCMQDS